MSQSIYLKSAISIADDLIAKAERDKHGVSWKSMSTDIQNNNATLWNASETIYNGVAGITLFFVELYKAVPEKKYLDIIEQSSSWLIGQAQDKPLKFYSLYSGRLGVAYCLAKVYQLTKEEIYKKEAVEIALKADSFFELGSLKYDLLVGPPGCILGLLHIYDITLDERLLPIVNLYIEKTLENMHLCEAGIYWNRSKDYMKGLCGFSHGAAGLGFIFLELGHYFKNDSFFWVAEQVFKYENFQFSETTTNWPDFRRSMYKQGDYEEFINHFEKGNIHFFTKGGDMNAWCHGAAGIGLSRINAYEYLKDEKYKLDLKKAVAKVVKTNIETKRDERSHFGLCHGACGNAELFISGFDLLQDPQLKMYSTQIADAAIEEYNLHKGYLSGYSSSKEQNDTSLFMGNAGIGYYMLRLNDSAKTENILAPRLYSTYKGNLDPEKYKAIRINRTLLKRRIIEKIFSRSIRIIEQSFPFELELFFESDNSAKNSLQQDFLHFVKETNAYKTYPHIQEIVSLEWDRYMTNESIVSDVSNFVQILYILEKFKQYETLSKQDFLKLNLKIVDGARINSTHFNWPDNPIVDIKQPLPEDEYYILLLPSFNGTLELAISDLLAALLTSFFEKNTVETVVQEVLENFSSQPQEVLDQIQLSVIQNIKYGIEKGMLLPLSCNS